MLNTDLFPQILKDMIRDEFSFHKVVAEYANVMIF